MFHELWHELIQIPDFITYMITPIVKATKNGKTKVFYTQFEYEEWRKVDEKGWKTKYYKGLGTSTRDEAKEYFKSLNIIPYGFSDKSDDSIELAFNKSKADDRKDWLKTYSRSEIILSGPGKTVLYEDFVNKDLIHFSNYNLERSIPNVMDGLKTSQRKILYSCFKRNLKSEIRVAQLAGYVSEHSGYHHGEASLNDAIVGMAHDFVGSNNMPWLVPQGQFGTRLDGGKDSARSGGNAQGANDQTEMIAKLISKYISKAVREISVTILWKKGSADQSFSVSTYWVNLNHDFELAL
jgi:DNA topoisomerase-2